jgi:Pyruvate/2-oxoacid:ferredoxin oxidoreductase delta subunit
MKPALNERTCPAQEQLCKAIPACPEEAITYVADNEAPLGGRIVFDETRCNGCGACADACCGTAIELI